jgi:hypothetical protein
VGYASRALTATQLKWDVSGVEAWFIVLMLRYFYWAINPKHIITTDHTALRWMDNMVKHNSPSHRQLVRFSLEINQSGSQVVKHRAGVLRGGPNALSRLVQSPHPNILVDCLFIRECSIVQVVAAQLPTLSMDTDWVDWADTPRSNPHKGNRVDNIVTEIQRQYRRNQSVALGPEIIAKSKAACSGPMENRVSNLRVLNISVGDGIPVAERLVLEHKDNAQQTLQAFLGAGLGGRDDTPLQSEWQDDDT